MTFTEFRSQLAILLRSGNAERENAFEQWHDEFVAWFANPRFTVRPELTAA